MTIEEELKTKKFEDPFQKANVNLLFTAGLVKASFNRRLKSHGITLEQYNVLRILKGSHPEPMCVKEITCRMIDRSSNTTRIIDKLEKKKLAERTPSANDGREVKVVLKKEAFQLLETVAKELEKLSKANVKFTASQAENLSQLLDCLRDAME